MRTEQKLLFNFRSTHAPFIFKMTTTISPVDSQSESMSPTYASLHHYLSADKSLLTKDMETKFKSVLDNPHICHVQPYNDNSNIMVVKVFEYASTSKLYILIIIHAPSPAVILALLKTSDISLRFYLEQTLYMENDYPPEMVKASIRALKLCQKVVGTEEEKWNKGTHIVYSF